MLTNTEKSPYAKVSPLPFQSVKWTEGFWNDVTDMCARSTVPHLQKMFEDKDISHVVENFRICAGEKEGEFGGTDFGDGDFYKWMEAAMFTAVKTNDQKLLEELDGYIDLIGRAQLPDGYISTKQILGERQQNGIKRFGNINDFDVNDPVPYQDLLEMDRWALTRLNKLVKDCTESYDRYDFHEAYHAINSFCIADMSNFYLDIIKDRLYTSKKNSLERRSAQTVMYEILLALVKILAPMTCYTAEEIWSFMPHRKGEEAESVMLTFYPEVDPTYDDPELAKKWKHMIELKELVAKRLEDARTEKVIGHSLNAKVTLFAEGEEYQFIQENLDTLTQVFIVSELVLEKNARHDEGEKVGVKVEPAEGEKCERCWKYSKTVGEDKENPTICHACSEALKD